MISSKTVLVEPARLESTIHLDIRYATTNNFVGRVVYRHPHALLQPMVAEALIRAHHVLQKHGYGIVIFDAYRPPSAVKLFWDVMPADKKQFVADPVKGSVHNRGCAVDVTLYEIKTGREVAMPSEFDEWTHRSRIDYTGGTPQSRHLRDLLRLTMESEGFEPTELEWWHYTWKDWEQFPLLDMEFDK